MNEPDPDRLPCGHTKSDIISTDEGTHYCGACADKIPPGGEIKLPVPFPKDLK